MKKGVLFLIACLTPMVLMAQEFKERTMTISLDFTHPVEANTLPKIQWITPLMELTGAPEPEVSVEVLVDSHHALSDVKVTVRSGDQSKIQNVNISGNEFSKDIALKVALFEGINEIVLTVTNIKGGKVSSSRTIQVEKNILSKLMYANRKDYALIFATDKYDNWTDLTSPVVGAEALNEILKTDYGFETELVKNPSLRDINRKLIEYEAKSYSGQDQLFVYFAGHCYFDKLMGFGYVVPSNSINNDPQKSTYLSQKDLRTTLDNFKCDHIFLVMDVCCADLADTRIEKFSPDVVTRQGLIDKLGVKTRKFLNSGDVVYSAGEGTGHVSPFTGRLVESLKQNSIARKFKTFTDVNAYFKALEIYSGGFGQDNPQSEFLFIPK